MEKLSYSRFPELLSSLLAKTRGTEHKRLLRFGLGQLKTRFEAGDTLALLECLILCQRYSHAIPYWVIQNLSEAVTKYYALDGKQSLDHRLGLRGTPGRAGAWRARKLAERNEILMFQIFCLTKAGYSLLKASEAIANRFFREFDARPHLKEQFSVPLPRKTASEFADTLRTIYYKGKWNDFWESASELPSVNKRIDAILATKKDAFLRDAQLPAS